MPRLLDDSQKRNSTSSNPNGLASSVGDRVNRELANRNVYNSMRSSAHGLQDNANDLYNQLYNQTSDPNGLRQSLSTVRGVDTMYQYAQNNGLIGSDGNNGNGGGGSGGGSRRRNSGVNTNSVYNGNIYQGGMGYSNNSNDYLARMRQILDEEKAQRDRATEAQYRALINQANRNYDTERNEASVNNARVNRWLDENYGGNITGMGLTNRLRASTDYSGALRDALARRDDSTLNAEQQRYSNLADAVANYANRYNNLASNLYGQELSNDMEKYRNQLDYDYRKYLATLGL